MKRDALSTILLAVCLLAYSRAPSLAVPPPATATCNISCTVANVVEWSQTSFPDVDLGTIAAENKQNTGETTLTLYTNGDVTITADNTNTAELSFGSQALLTKYMLRYDGSGVTQTGGETTKWRPFDTFLKEPANIVHIPEDGSVEVILSVEASIEEISPEDSGRYNATQTLTVCWIP